MNPYNSYIKSKAIEVEHITIIDAIFILGIVLAPMTALRIYKFGPGENLLIIWMLIVVSGSNPSSIYKKFCIPITEIGAYQIANLVMMFIGMIVNVVLYQATVNLSGAVTTFLSHLFMFLLSSCIFLYFDEATLGKIHSIISRIVIYGAVVYGLLLFYAYYFNTSFLGIPLWLGGRGYRFLGLALNPHQIGMITGAGIWFSLYLMSVSETVKLKLAYVLVAIIWFIIALSLRSDTMTISNIILVVLFVIIKVLKIVSDTEVMRNNTIIFIILGIIILIVMAPGLWSALNNFVHTAGNGLGRLELWRSGLGQFREKPVCLLTGLGPNGSTGLYMKVSGHQVEAHNTYIQQIINSGIFIFFYYTITVLKLISHPTEKNTYLVMAVIYFILYGFGGNMNRRVLVWFTYTMAMILFEKTKDMEISEK